RGANRVAVDEGGDDAAVEQLARPGRKSRPRLEPAHGFLALPVALDLQPVRVLGAAAETVVVAAQLVLDRASLHGAHCTTSEGGRPGDHQPVPASSSS